MAYQRRRRRHRARAFRYAGLVALAAAVCLAAFAAYRDRGLQPVVQELRDADRRPLQPIAAVPDRRGRPEAPSAKRAVYRYSVVPGGVYDSREVLAASDRDPLVRAHYAELRLDRIRARRTSSAQLRYMSYRTGSGIYWTRQPVRLARGELTLGDGVHELRARCGNLIAREPRTPVQLVDPPPAIFEEIEPEPPIAGAPPVAAGAPPTPPVTLLPPLSARPPVYFLPPASLPPVAPGPAGPGGPAVPPLIWIWTPNDRPTPPGTTPPTPGQEPPGSIPNPNPEDPLDPHDPDDPRNPDQPGDPRDPSVPDPPVPPADPPRPPVPVTPEPPPVAVPEPGTVMLVGVGGAIAALSRVKRRH